MKITKGATMYKAPEPTDDGYGRLCIFLAGSIEMGKAEDWQTKLFHSIITHDVTVYNPRRENWDSSWTQDISNPFFKEQVVWELDHIDLADVVVFYFDAHTMSPITLMELGIVLEMNASNDDIKGSRVLVCCPEGYWRRGNVQIVCDRYSIPLLNTFEELTSELVKVLEGFKV